MGFSVYKIYFINREIGEDYECGLTNHTNHIYEFLSHTVYPKKYADGFCFAVLCCGYTLTDFPISIRLTLLALWQSNDCHSASKATLMNMDKYFMWIHYERLHNHNKAKHNKTVCIFLGIYCTQCMTLGKYLHGNWSCNFAILYKYLLGFHHKLLLNMYNMYQCKRNARSLLYGL